MVVIDIDQDFFFDPPLYDMDFKEGHSKKQKQIISIEDFVNKYNLKERQYTIFRDHHQAYNYIKNIGKIDKLLHFDAHHDFCGYHREVDKIDDLNIGNWIGHLVKDGLCDDIEWITCNKDTVKNDSCYLNTVVKNYGKDYSETFYDYDNHIWNGEIDHVIFTISYYFCPNITDKFIESMG